MSTWPNSEYVFESGSSMASPHVAGVAALLVGRAPALGGRALRRALRTGAIRSPQITPGAAWGQVFAPNALAALPADTTAPRAPQLRTTVSARRLAVQLARNPSAVRTRILLDGTSVAVLGSRRRWRSPQLAPRTYRMQLIAEDRAGNVRKSSTRTVRIR